MYFQVIFNGPTYLSVDIALQAGGQTPKLREANLLSAGRDRLVPALAGLWARARAGGGLGPSVSKRPPLLRAGNNQARRPKR